MADWKGAIVCDGGKWWRNDGQKNKLRFIFLKKKLLWVTVVSFVTSCELIPTCLVQLMFDFSNRPTLFCFCFKSATFWNKVVSFACQLSNVMTKKTLSVRDKKWFMVLKQAQQPVPFFCCFKTLQRMALSLNYLNSRLQ